MFETPPNSVIKAKIEKLLPKVDIETMTRKQFNTILSKKMGGADLSSKKKFIKATLTDIINSRDEESDEDSEEESEEEESGKSKVGGGGGGGGGLMAEKEISDDLADFLGQGKHMARTAIVKGLWDYIKEHGLQNPDDKREILLDDRLQRLFHVPKFTMFTMNKHLGAHIYPFKKPDFSESGENKKKRKREPDKKKKAKKGAARKQGTQTPYRLSEDLANVVGKDILPRPQVTQALWAYIRKHNLQNPENKREILCDARLKKVMGGNSKVTMFSMNKYITPHMIEKVDKSEYQHEENGISHDTRGDNDSDSSGGTDDDSSSNASSSDD